MANRASRAARRAAEVLAGFDALPPGLTMKESAARLGVPQTTLHRYIEQRAAGMTPGTTAANPPVVSTVRDPGYLIESAVASESHTDEELVHEMARRFERRQANADSTIRIRMTSDAPVAQVWLGDPHVDDDGCDWPRLRADIATIAATPGMYACSLGDHHNNWVGRLGRLYAEQETSRRQAWQLIRWLFNAVRWQLVVAGNHDAWEGGDLLQWLATHAGAGAVQDWAIRAQLIFPNGTTWEVDARHDHPGHSMWNKTHAQLRASLFNSGADLYIAGHRHSWGLQAVEDVQRNKVVWLARAKGYKTHDHYALVKGFEQQRHGAAITAVVDPRETDPQRRTKLFVSVQEGAEYLTWLRGQRAG